MPRPKTARASPQVKRNLAFWERSAAWYETEHTRVLGGGRAKAWGMWRIPERRLRLLGNVRGKDVLELGCGAARWSIALAQDGARIVGLDFSPQRLEQARKLMARTRVEFPLVEASADRIPYPRRSFDIVFSDHGAPTWTDPYRTLPEVARVLRPGGIFAFAVSSPFRYLAMDRRTERIGRRLVHDYFGMHEIRFRETTEFQLPYGEWVRLFTDCGLQVETLYETRPPGRVRSSYLSAEEERWARRWPLETIWKVRKLLPGRSRA